MSRRDDVLAWLDTLTPLARRIARKAGRSGATVADLRHYATTRGLMSGVESRTRASYLGHVMRRAGLVPTGRYARSTVARSHRNIQMVWVLPEYTRRAS